MWLELPCPATPHTIQPRCPCHATHHSNGLILHCLDTQGAPDTPRELFVDERLYYMTCPAEGSRVPHSNIVGDRPWENAPSNLHNAAVCPSRVLTPLHCPPCLPPTAHSALTALTSESCLLTLPPPTSPKPAEEAGVSVCQFGHSLQAVTPRKAPEPFCCLSQITQGGSGSVQRRTFNQPRVWKIGKQQLLVVFINCCCCC